MSSRGRAGRLRPGFESIDSRVRFERWVMWVESASGGGTGMETGDCLPGADVSF